MLTFRTLILALLFPSVLDAQPVALKEGLGQGLMLRHSGNCYVIFPSHVHKAGPVFNLFTPSPQAGGIATVYFRRSEPDIAVGVVSGSAQERCTDPFSALPRDSSLLLSRSRSATLERVNPQGGLERLAMRIERIAWMAATDDEQSGLYQYVIASTDEAAGETREVYQGTSGSILYIEDTPVAMVVTAPDSKTIRALRIEEVSVPLARWLASGSFGALQEDKEVVASLGGLPFKVSEWTGRLADENLVPTGLSNGSAPFRAYPSEGVASIVIELTESDPIGVRELVLVGPASGTEFAAPKKIAIDVDRTRKGPADFQHFTTVGMTQNGPISVKMNTLARRIRVRVLSAWVTGQPVEISGVRVVAPN